MDALSRRRQLKRAIEFLKSFLYDLSETRTTGMAAEMAFWVFLSLLPLAAVAGLVLARIAVGSTEVGVVLSSLPPQTHQLIHRQLARVAAWNGGSVGPTAAAVFVWLASGGVNAVFELLEVKAGASRPWWKRRLFAIGTCVGLSIGIATIAILFTGINWVLALVHGIVPFAGFVAERGWIDRGVRFTLGIAAAVGMVAGLYWAAVPRKARTHLRIWPGALVAVGLQVVLGYGYVFYLSKVGAGGAYSAGLSIVGVTLMALYLFAIALLVGAELNHLLSFQSLPEDQRNGPRRPSRRAPHDGAGGTSGRPRDGGIAPPVSFEKRDGAQPSSRIPPTAR
jgi:membrane protein